MKKYRLAFIFLSAILITIVSTVYASERLVNGDFENTPFDGWDPAMSMYATITAAAAPAPVRSGSYSGQYDHAASLGYSLIGQCLDDLTDVEGLRYTFSGYIYVPSSETYFNNLRLMMRPYRDTGCNGGLPQSTANITITPRDSWVYFEHTFIANTPPTSDSASANLMVRSTDGPDADSLGEPVTVYFDDLQFYDVPASTPVGLTGNWHTAATWTDNSVPDATDDVYITPGKTVTVDADAAARRIFVGENATLIIPDGVTLTSEEVVTNNGMIRQTKTTPSSATTRFLHIQNQAGTTDQYFGVDITPSTGSMGATTVEIRGNKLDGCNVGDQLIHRCFDIAPAVPQTATVRFWYLNDELNGETVTDMNAYHWNGSGWDALTLAGTPRGTSGDYEWVEAVGVDAYSPFGLADGSPGSPTAVSLQSISAQAAAVPGAVWLIPLIVTLALGGYAALRKK